MSIFMSMSIYVNSVASVHAFISHNELYLAINRKGPRSLFVSRSKPQIQGQDTRVKLTGTQLLAQSSVSVSHR